MTLWTFLGLLILSLIPFYGIYFIVGGIGPNEIFLTFLLLVEGSVIITLIGLFCSASFSKTVNAITMSYVLNLAFYSLPFILAILQNAILQSTFPNLDIVYLMMIVSPFGMGIAYIDQPPFSPLAMSLLPWLHAFFMFTVIVVLIGLNFFVIAQRGLGGKLNLLPNWFKWPLKTKNPQSTKSQSSIRSLSDQVNPVFWKENTEMDGKNKAKQMVVFICLFAFGLLILLFNLLDSNGQRIWDDSMIAWTVFMTPFLIVPYAVHAFRSEFDRKAWDVLQTTTLSTQKVIFGKLKAGLRLFAWRFGAFYGVIFLAGLYTFFQQYQHYKYFNLLPGWLLHNSANETGLLFPFVFLCFVWSAFYLSSGFYISALCKNTTTAYVQMMLLVLFIMFGPIFIIVLFENFFRVHLEVILRPSSIISPFALLIGYWELDDWGLYLILHLLFMLGASAVLLRLTKRTLVNLDR